MTRILFLIIHTDVDGEDKDLLVVAEDVSDAWRIWLDYYHNGDASEVTWLDQTLKTSTPTTRQSDAALKFYQARPDVVIHRALKWHSPALKLIAWMEGI